MKTRNLVNSCFTGVRYGLYVSESDKSHKESRRSNISSNHCFISITCPIHSGRPKFEHFMDWKGGWMNESRCAPSLKGYIQVSIRITVTMTGYGIIIVVGPAPSLLAAVHRLRKVQNVSKVWLFDLYSWNCSSILSIPTGTERLHLCKIYDWYVFSLPMDAPTPTFESIESYNCGKCEDPESTVSPSASVNMVLLVLLVIVLFEISLEYCYIL